MASCIIIGAGTFGAATAQALKKRHELSKLRWSIQPVTLTRALRRMMSTKIVRDDYPDQLYMRMMQKAIRYGAMTICTVASTMKLVC